MVEKYIRIISGKYSTAVGKEHEIRVTPYRVRQEVVEHLFKVNQPNISYHKGYSNVVVLESALG